LYPFLEPKPPTLYTPAEPKLSLELLFWSFVTGVTLITTNAKQGDKGTPDQ